MYNQMHSSIHQDRCRIYKRFGGTRCSFRHTELEVLGEHLEETANRALGSLGLEFRKEVSVERNLGVNHFICGG